MIKGVFGSLGSMVKRFIDNDRGRDVDVHIYNEDVGG
jgi:hypothetical protein